MTFDPAAVQHAYEDIAGDYEASFADDIEDDELDRSVLDAAIGHLSRGDVVLDVGCGPGQVARRAVAAGGSGVGIDLTPAMLAIARRRASALPLIGGDVRALPIRSGIAAAAVAWFSLHNLPRPLLPLALAELRRVLRPRGVAVIATHGGTGEQVVSQERDGRRESVAITYLEVDELLSLADRAGLVRAVVRERAPLAHEHPAAKLYMTAFVP